MGQFNSTWEDSSASIIWLRQFWTGLDCCDDKSPGISWTRLWIASAYNSCSWGRYTYKLVFLIKTFALAAHYHNYIGPLVFVIIHETPHFNIPNPFSTALFQGLKGSILYERIPYCFSDICFHCGWVVSFFHYPCVASGSHHTHQRTMQGII